MISANEKRQQARDKEENAIHNPKCKACLEHCASLISTDMEASNASSHCTEVNRVCLARADIRAFVVRNEA